MVAGTRRQKHVDEVLDRFFSLAKNRASAIGPRYLTLRQTRQKNASTRKTTVGDLREGKRTAVVPDSVRDEFQPIIATVLDRVR
ncbi:hypothetical protein BH09ACT7_BH09ACT7_04750 [soil metagenome]